MSNTKSNLTIEKVKQSRIDQVDFSIFIFGKVFSDHMYICHYKDGKWQQPEIKPYAPITLEPSASVFHYGQAVFEGMKAYKDDNDRIFLSARKKTTNASTNHQNVWQFLNFRKNGLTRV